MTDNDSVLSTEEMNVLEEIDNGQPISEIAKKMGITIQAAQQILREAETKRRGVIHLAEEMKLSSPRLRVIDDRLNVTQEGTMKVGSQILKYLSEGIYSSPAGSLKELISNAFDADSPFVEISINPNEVIIKDHGQGMNYKDFDEDFTFISRSIKRNEGLKTKKYNRPIVGFLGIGFISVSELCDKMVIKSCKENEDAFFVAEIDFSKYRRREAAAKEFYEVSKYKITNYLKKDFGLELNCSFTEIKLKELRSGFKQILEDTKPFESLKTSIQDIMKYINYNGGGITDLGQYWQMIWEIACMAPIKYMDKDDKNDKSAIDPKIAAINATLKSYNFLLKINDIEMLKPFDLPFDKSLKSNQYVILPIKESISTSKGKLSFTGYMYSQHGIINPKEYIGVLIRIKNISIGSIDKSFLDYPSGANQVFRNWVFGEIYIQEGLEDALNINRNQFKVTDPDYIALRQWLHRFLDAVVFKYTLNEFYKKASIERQEIRKSESIDTLKQITRSEMGSDYCLKFEAHEQKQPVYINHKEKTVTINSSYPGYQTPARLKPMIQQLFLLFEIAYAKSNGDSERLRKTFQTEIEKWLR